MSVQTHAVYVITAREQAHMVKNICLEAQYQQNQ